MGSATGIDSLEPSSAAILTNAIGPDFLRRKARFLGAVFSQHGPTRSLWRRRSRTLLGARERFFAPKWHSLMPIARQTSSCWRKRGPRRATCAVQRRRNFRSPIIHLSRCCLPKRFVYLDIEQSHPVSKDYYSAWAETLIAYSQTQSAGKVTLHFQQLDINARGADIRVVNIASAVAGGAHCNGAWVARYYFGKPTQPAWTTIW